MIRFRDVIVRYPRATRDALAGVSFDAPAGTLTAVVGPNGSGKSTLIRSLIGRATVVSGAISVGDRPLDGISRRDVARQIAVVAQREELLFPTEVRDYVALGRFPHGDPWSPLSADDRRAVDAAVERADVGGFLDRRVDTLSGGEWQRVRLARALAQSGRALVLDEPTAFLDVAHEMTVFELLVSLAAEGQCVLLVSHHLNLVARFATQIVLLKDGRVAASGTPDSVMRAEVLERVYEWPLVVSRDPVVGAPALVPLRSTSSPQSPTP